MKDLHALDAYMLFGHIQPGDEVNIGGSWYVYSYRVGDKCRFFRREDHGQAA